MFAIFSLRRPDILPVGDLGLQKVNLCIFGSCQVLTQPDKKGLLRWILSSHNGTNITISPRKLAQQPQPGASEQDVSSLPPIPHLTPNSNTSNSVVQAVTDLVRSQTPLKLLTSPTNIPSAQGSPVADKSQESATVPFVLPDGITLAILKSRFDGKKVKCVSFANRHVGLVTFYILEGACILARMKWNC